MEVFSVPPSPLTPRLLASPRRPPEACWCFFAATNMFGIGKVYGHLSNLRCCLTHLTWRWWTNKFKNGFLKYESLDPTWRARQIKGGGLRNSIVKTIGPLAGNTNKGTNCIKGPGCASLKAFHVPRKLAERHALSETNSKHPWKQVIKQKGITSSTYWFSGAMLVSGDCDQSLPIHNISPTQISLK